MNLALVCDQESDKDALADQFVSFPAAVVYITAKGPFTLAIFAAISSTRDSNRRGIASSLHGRFEIAVKSQQKSPLKTAASRRLTHFKILDYSVQFSLVSVLR